MEYNHWQVSLNQVCVIPFETGNGYTSNYTWGGVKTDRKPAAKKYLEKEEYKRIKKHIEKLLELGVTNILPHLAEYDISTKAKHGHIKAVKNRLGIRRDPMSAQILDLIDKIGPDHDEISKRTGARKEYIDQVISRNKRRTI